MPSPLSPDHILAIQPIIDKIDFELTKDQKLREKIKIQTPNPPKLKNLLNNYKTFFRRKEWNQRFFIWKKSDCIIIDFSPKRGIETSNLFSSITVGEAPVTEAPLVLGIIGGSNEPLPVEANDIEILSTLMQAQPQRLLVRYDFLNDETKRYVQDPLNAPSSALVNYCNRRGYRMYRINDNVLITTENLSE